MEEFISVKGWKSLGNKLSNKKVKQIKWLDSLQYEEEQQTSSERNTEEVPESNNTIPVKDEHNETLIIKNVEVEEIAETEDEETIKTSSKKPNISDEGAQQITLDL